MNYSFKNIYLLIFILLLSASTFAQDISTLKNTDINALSDEQIAAYWESIQKNGYTMAQVETLAKAQGIPASKVAEFKLRVNNLNQIKKAEDNIIKTKAIANITSEPYGVKNGQVVQNKSEGPQLFGYNFFNNSKITFQPNVNIAVPKNYQIGPGDEIMIDLWGASEITYTAIVSKTGSIKINGVGFIYINGFTLEAATKKIISRLKRKHAGIGASKNSYERINTNVTVSKIRTVQVNIIGEVKVPGTYSINSLSTVLNALYVAGGPTKLGTFRDIKLIRNNKTIASLDIYEYLLNGTQNANLKLQDQDVLLVGPYQNLITVEGAVKRPGIYELNTSQTLADLINYFGGFTSNSYTDLLVLERFDGIQKEVKEVNLKNASSFLMQSGDRILVQEVLDLYKNKVSIEGEVYRPGNFELTENMTLKDLLLKAEGVTPEAFLNRANIIRSTDNTNQENIPFSVTDILNDIANIPLLKNDKIIILNKKDLRENRTVTITGAVNKPQTFEYIDNLQIEDLISKAGGLKEGANPDLISVARRLKDGSFKTLSQIFSVSSTKNLEINNGNPFYIKPFDIIDVRYTKGYDSQKSVKIEGQVNYAGSYILQNKEERLSSLIERAGGLNAFADIDGAKFYRNNNLVSIDLKPILNKTNSKNDIILQEGDLLVIPEKVETVQVTGNVIIPSLVKHQNSKNLKYYIDNAGGFKERSKKSNIYVRYANGQVKTTTNFLFFKFYPKVKPGSTIVVPEKAEKEKLSTQEVLGITSSIATLALIIQTLAK